MVSGFATAMVNWARLIGHGWGKIFPPFTIVPNFEAYHIPPFSSLYLASCEVKFGFCAGYPSGTKRSPFLIGNFDMYPSRPLLRPETSLEAKYYLTIES